MIDAHVHILNVFPRNTGLDPSQLAAELECYLDLFGVSRIIAVGYLLSDAESLLRLKTQLAQKVYVGLGVHPWMVKDHGQLDSTSLGSILLDADLIGETGLDFYRAKSNQERLLQESLLTKHLDAAELSQRPVILHWVKALHRQTSLFDHRDLTGIVHGWSGNRQEAEYWIEKGFLLGIGPRLLMRQTREDLSWIPLSSLLIETDFPDIPASLLPLLDNNMGHRVCSQGHDWTEASRWVAALRWTTDTVAQYLGLPTSTLEDISADNLTRILAKK